MMLSKKCAILWVPTLLLAGCESWGEKTPSRNFDELIPRLMGAIQNRSPEDAAANLFNVTNPDERRDAIAYLQTQKWGHEPPYMRAYQLLTTDPHPMVKGQALRALGSSRKPAEAVSYLVKGLDNPDATVRNDAAIGLQTTYSDEAAPALCAHVKDDVNEQVRINCARALIHFSTPEAVRSLISALDDRDAAVALYALESLRSVTRENFAYDVKEWLAWYERTYAPATQPGPVIQ